MNSVRILGIDPGLRHTGWGVIVAEGSRLRAVGQGTISPDTKLPLSERLLCLHQGLGEVIQAYQPEEAAIEETFATQNGASTLKLGHARAAGMLAAAAAELPVSEYAPRLVKKAVVGTGSADKTQIAAMVRQLLPSLPKTISADAADALAVAITHAHHRTLMAHALPSYRAPHCQSWQSLAKVKP